MTDTTEHAQRLADAAAAVRGVFLSLAKLISAKTIYTGNNPTLIRFAGAFHSAVQAFFEHQNELQIRVEQYRLLWRDEVVYESADRGGSIAFMLFKDGVGELTLFASVTMGELDQLADILKEEIHNPSPTLDVVTRLWNADFANVSYRVLDDDPTAQPDGERGTGARVRASLLQAEDHPDNADGTSGTVEHSASSIADYLLGVVTASRPESNDAEKEHFVQDMLATLFAASADEQEAFLEEHADDARTDKIEVLLETALDFTMTDESTMQENALFLVERSAGYALSEADARTLTRALGLVRERAASHPNNDIRMGLERLERDFTDADLLRSLGRNEDQPTEEVLGVLRYLRLVGESALPVVLDLLRLHSRTVIHREGCDTILALAGDRIESVLAELDVDNVHIARDAIRLLQASPGGTIPPLLREFVHYPDVQVREGTLRLLAQSGADEAVALLCVLLDDEDKGIRLQTLAQLERIGGVAAASKVMTLCVTEGERPRDTDEKMRLFEAAGRIAPDDIVSHLQGSLKKRSWLRLGAQTSPEEKKLAVAALRYARDDRAQSLLERLARDGDDGVGKAARSALDERNGSGPERGGGSS